MRMVSLFLCLWNKSTSTGSLWVILCCSSQRHHSFLPAFIGAKPYHQAFERGVKIIGATAHFVNNELDEGPIILQDVSSVTHANTAEMMAKMGKDVEKTVFCKALQLASEHKLFINGNKTVVFS